MTELESFPPHLFSDFNYPMNRWAGHSIKYAASFFMFAVALGLCGCQGKYEATVSGEVTLDGQALGPGNVIFTPKSGGNPAIGAIQSNGNYRVKTSRDVGIKPGDYLVAVRVNEPPPAGTDPNERRMTSTLAHPKRYTSNDTSGFEYTVEPGSNTIDLALSAQE